MKCHLAKLGLLIRKGHIAFDCQNYAAMDESILSAADEIEHSAIEEIAGVPNADKNMAVCSCRGMCLREKGRNACPCKETGQFCSSVCHPDSTSCWNRLNQSDTDNSSETSEGETQGAYEHDSDEAYDIQEPSAKRARGRARGQRKFGETSSRDRETASETIRGSRARGRGRSRGRSRGRGRGRGRGVGRGRLQAEENAEQRVVDHEQQLQNLVANMDLDALRRLALELLRRQPATFADLVNGELPFVQGQLPDPDDPDRPDPPPDESPEWCFCGCCAPMPSQDENKCCSRRLMPCITINPLFNQLVLDANVLDIAMRYREDILVMDHPRNNENFRHSAYRQFVLWQHGRLGRGNRVVLPSCCVLAIRARYPSPNGVYTGFRPARL